MKTKTWQNGRITTDLDEYHGKCAVIWHDTKTGLCAYWFGSEAACRNRAKFPPPREGAEWIKPL